MRTVNPPIGKKPKQLLLSLGLSPFVANEKGDYIVDIIFDKNKKNKVRYKFNIDYFPEKQKKEGKSAKG